MPGGGGASPAPPRLIAGDRPTARPVAQGLVAKYADHGPPYRRCPILARWGIAIDRSVLACRVGYTAAEIKPVWRLLRSTKLFVDETTAPVLDPGRGRTGKGYFRALARDDRPWQGEAPPAVVYGYAPGGATAENQAAGCGAEELEREHSGPAPWRIDDRPGPALWPRSPGGWHAFSMTAASRSAPTRSSAACARLLRAEKCVVRRQRQRRRKPGDAGFPDCDLQAPRHQSGSLSDRRADPARQRLAQPPTGRSPAPGPGRRTPDRRWPRTTPARQAALITAPMPRLPLYSNRLQPHSTSILRRLLPLLCQPAYAGGQARWRQRLEPREKAKALAILERHLTMIHRDQVFRF
jgi:hypothetical protein